MRQIFCERLRELRIEKGLQQKQVAEALGINKSNITNWEIGRTEPDMDMIVALSKYFEVTVDYLLGLED